MNSNPFVQATKEQALLRMALVGPAGSGKTYSALNIAQHLAPSGKVAVIDTEHGSARKYADKFKFDVIELTNFAPANYVTMIQAAQQFGYDVLIIDSLSHAWNGTGGVLEIVDKASQNSKNNTYVGWAKGTPAHNALIDAILASNLHIIVTMRSKTDYVLEVGNNGKTTPRKVGTAPVQRDGVDYEFDVVGELTTDNTLTVTKTRCSELHEASFAKPGADIAGVLRAWLTDGEPQPEPAPQPPAQPAHAETPTAPVVDSTQRQTPEKGQNGAQGNDLASVMEDAPTNYHWWLDNEARQNFWIGNSRAHRMKEDVAQIMGIPPSKAENSEAQEWVDAMSIFANPGEALTHLAKEAKAKAS